MREAKSTHREKEMKTNSIIGEKKRKKKFLGNHKTFHSNF